jgi:hypothetical protein
LVCGDGDSYGTALAETIDSLHKSEVIEHDGRRGGKSGVEALP